MSRIGRPPKNPDWVKVPYSTRLPRYQVEWLRQQDNAAELIYVAIEDYRNRQPLGDNHG